MASRESRLINRIKRNAPAISRAPAPTPIASNMIIPNHSGSVKTPTRDGDIANKSYVDSLSGGAPEGTAVKSTGETGGTKFLREDGDGTCSWQDVSGGGASELSDLSDVNSSTPTNKNVLVADGVDWESRALVEADISDLGSYMENVSEDTTPQLGGNLDVNGNKITSISNGNIDIEPNGTGDVLIGNFTFDADQSVGAGQDNYVLTYDNSSGKISLEAASGGGETIFSSSLEADSISAAGTSYASVQGKAGETSEDTVTSLAPKDFTMSDLCASALSNSLSGVCNITFRINKADTSLTLAISAGSTGNFTDASNTASVSQYDKISIKVAAASGTGSIRWVKFGMLGA